MAASDAHNAVYFVQSLTTGQIKIGTSISPMARLKQLCAERRDDTLVLLATIPGSFRLEGQLHSHFRDASRGGEWFEPVPELVAMIADVAAGRRVFGLPHIPTGWAEQERNAPAIRKVA